MFLYDTQAQKEVVQMKARTMNFEDCRLQLKASVARLAAGKQEIGTLMWKNEVNATKPRKNALWMVFWAVIALGTQNINAQGLYAGFGAEAAGCRGSQCAAAANSQLKDYAPTCVSTDKKEESIFLTMISSLLQHHIRNIHTLPHI